MASTNEQKRIRSLVVHNSSLLQQQEQQQRQQRQYSYSCLSNGNVSSTNVIVAPTSAIFSNNDNISSSASHSLSPQQRTILPRLLTALPSINEPSCSFLSSITSTAENGTLISLSNSQISLTSSATTSTPRPSTIASSKTAANGVQLSFSPIKPRNETHLLDNTDLNIFEADQLFKFTEEKENVDRNNINTNVSFDQLQLNLFGEEFPALSKATNRKEFGNIKTPSMNESTPMIKNLILPQPIQPNMNKKISLLPDQGLSADPRKWTVDDVGQFIARLTNDLIAEVFYQDEMNGKALLVTTKEYLHDTMKIKLGPSLIISSEVTKL